MIRETRTTPVIRSLLKRRAFWILLGSIVVAIAYWAAQSSGPNYRGQTAKHWFELYGSRDGNDREMAVAAFRAMGSNAVPMLVDILESPPPESPGPISELLNKIRKIPTNPIQQHNWRRQRACHLLREIGEPARGAIPALERASSDGLWYIATSSRAALIRIRHEPLTQYYELLKDRSDPVKWYPTAILLGYSGSNATPAIPLLVESLADSSQIIQAHAIVALGMIGSEPQISVPHIIPFLTNSSVALRQKAFSAVIAFKDNAQSASNHIIFGLNDPDPWTRRQAVRACEEVLSPVDQLRAVPRLETLTEDPEPFVRDSAVELLREIRNKDTSK